jgi:hypothetical protein
MLGLRFFLFSFIALLGVVMSAPTPAYANSDHWALQEYNTKGETEKKEREGNRQSPAVRFKTPPPPRLRQLSIDELSLLKKEEAERGSCTIM